MSEPHQIKSEQTRWKDREGPNHILFSPRGPASGDYIDEIVIEKLGKRKVVILESSQLYPGLDNLYHTHQLRYLNLSKNSTSISVQDLENMPTLEKLVKLDLSGNALTQLPSAEFFEKFPSLRTLYLHGNFLKDESFVASLAPLKNLIYITIFNNPLPRKIVRQKLIETLPQLEAIDFLAVLDWEKDFSLSSAFIEIQMTRAEIRWPIVTVPMPSDERTIMKAIYEELRVIHRTYNSCNIVVKLQKLMRGTMNRRRTAFAIIKGHKITRDAMIKILRRWKQRARLQRITRSVLEERGKLEYYYLGAKGRARNVQELVKQFVQKLKEKREFTKAVINLQRAMRQTYGQMFSLYKDPLKLYNLRFYNSFYVLAEHKDKTMDLIAEMFRKKPKLLEGFDGDELYEQIRENVTTAHDIRTLRWEKNINIKDLPLHQLIRAPMKTMLRIYTPVRNGDYYIKNSRKIKLKRKTTCHLTTQEREKFHQKLIKINNFIDKNYRQLIKIEIPHLSILENILKYIFNYNAAVQSGNSVNIYLDRAIHRVSAAVKIQTFYRRKRAVKHSPYYDIFQTLKEYRAAVILQRWIRNFKFKCRMDFLSNIGYFMSKISGRSLYIEEDVYANLADIHEKNLRRVHLLDQEVSVFVNHDTGLCMVARNPRNDLPTRPFLPKWVEALEHPDIRDLTSLADGDIINLLHTGTKISRKVRDGVKYYKFRFPRVEIARYVAGAVGLMTFNLKNRGFYIKLADKKKWKGQLEKYRDHYHMQVCDVYGIDIAKNLDQSAVDDYLGRKRRAALTRNYNNCCFLYTENQEQFSALVEENAKENAYEVKVRFQDGADQPTYLDKTTKHLFRNYNNQIKKVMFVPWIYFNKIAKREQRSAFENLIKILRGRSEHKEENFQKLKNIVKKVTLPPERDTFQDTKQLFIQEVTLRRSFYKAKEIVAAKQTIQDTKDKLYEIRANDLKSAQYRNYDQRMTAQSNRHIIDMAKGALVKQKQRENQKEKQEMLEKMRSNSVTREQTAKRQIRDIQQSHQSRKQSAQHARDGNSFVSAISMLMAEEDKDEIKRRRYAELEEARQKIARVKDRRLEEKALNLIVQELKRPKGDTILGDYDKSLVEQTVSMAVNKIDVSFDSSLPLNDSYQTYAKTTHSRFVRLLERRNGQGTGGTNEDTMMMNQTYDIRKSYNGNRTKSLGVHAIRRDSSLGTSLGGINHNGSRTMGLTPVPSRTEKSISKHSGTKPKLPSIHGKLLEDIYPTSKLRSGEVHDHHDDYDNEEGVAEHEASIVN